MKLTEEQHQAIRERLRPHLERGCMFCAHLVRAGTTPMRASSWVINEDTITCPAGLGVDVDFVLVVCGYCSISLLFSSALLGLVPMPEQPPVPMPEQPPEPA